MKLIIFLTLFLFSTIGLANNSYTGTLNSKPDLEIKIDESNLSTLASNKLDLMLNISKNCLGLLLLDRGQSLLPAPPDRIIGLIFIIE